MVLDLLEEMVEKYNITKTAVAATGCVAALTVAGLLKVKQESRTRLVS
jgi:hypothetical protein